MEKRLVLAGFILFFIATWMNLVLDAAGITSPAWYNVAMGLLFTITTIIHGARYFGRFRTGVLVIVTAVISFVMEFAGVKTGMIYGEYYYGSGLGPKILDTVPFIIPLSWFMFMYISMIMTNVILSGKGSLAEFLKRKAGAVEIFVYAFVDSVAMTALDIIIDPICAHKGAWVWTGLRQLPPERVLFNIPVQNFFGWFVTTMIIFTLFRAAFFLRKDVYSDKDGIYYLPVFNYAAIFAVGTIMSWTVIQNTGVIFVSIMTLGTISVTGLYRTYRYFTEKP